MRCGGIFDYEVKHERLEEVNLEMEDPDIWNDQEKAQALSKERASLDHVVSTLLDDLKQRGLLEETLVVMLTDFGRTPKINGAAGRDHYPNVYSIFLAGGGVQGGQVYGSSDRNGAFPASHACTPADVHATIHNAMGIDPNKFLYDGDRPVPVTDNGTPAAELFG